MRKVNDDRKFSFTDTRLERWEADPEREVCLYDADKPNLVLRISPTGTKTFYFWRTDRSKPKAGKSSHTAKRRIGLLSETTVKQARDEVDRINGETVEAGGTVPVREKPNPKAITLGDAFAAYIAQHVATGGKCEDNYRAWYRLYLEKFAKTPMDSITATWINDHVKIGIVTAQVDAKRKRARRDGGRQIANSVIALLSTMFTLYLRDHDPEGRRANPCDRVELYKKRARKQALSVDEQGRFIDAIKTYKREHAVYKITREYAVYVNKKTGETERRYRGWVKGAPIAKKIDLADLLLVALLTGRRRGSISRMKYADLTLNTEHPTWTIPPEDNKAGVEDVVTLPPELARMLRERRKAADKGAKYVLPGAVDADPRKTFRAILGIAGITNPRIVPHSLRATWITNGLRMKESTESVRNAVGHSSISSTQGYSALLNEDKRRVSNAIADAILNGRTLEEEAA